MLGHLFSEPKLKQYEVGRGEFHCPNCRCKTQYRRFERVQVRRMLLIRFRGDVQETFIVCENCKRQMKDEDLRGNLPNDTRVLLTAIKEKLKLGQSLQGAAQALMDAGMPEGEARRLVHAAAGIVLRKCPGCSRTYLDSAMRCERCGTPLST